MAALILGAISQVESAMEIVDRVCDPLLRGGVTTAGSTVALLVQRELETLSSQ
jgi:cobalamin biosynthesis protein CobD/CbiB